MAEVFCLFSYADFFFSLCSGTFWVITMREKVVFLGALKYKDYLTYLLPRETCKKAALGPVFAIKTYSMV